MLRMGKFGEWLNIATNIGVIVGLILVAYQVDQTNTAMERDYRAAQTSMRLDSNAPAFDFRYRIADNPELADIWLRGNAAEELSPIEQERYYQIAVGHFALYKQYYDSRRVLQGETLDWFVDGYVTEVKDKPGLRAVLERHEKSGWGNTTFMRLVKKKLSELPR